MLKRKMLGVMIMSALALNANADESVKSDSPLLSGLSVLPINDTSKSFMMDELEQRFDMASISPMRSASIAAIPSVVSQHDIILLDAQYYRGQTEYVNAYLKAAHKQNKVIIIENARSVSPEAFKEVLTAAVTGDVVVIHPTNSAEPEKIFIYNAESEPAVQGHIQLTDAEAEYDTDAVDLFKPLPSGSTLNALTSQARETVLKDVMNDLVAMRSDASLLPSGSTAHGKTKEGMTSSNGIVTPYSCQQVLWDARKCRAYEIKISDYPYNYNGNQITNTYYTDYTMFKTRFNKFVAVQFSGTASPTLSNDSDTKKGWWLQQVVIDVNVFEGSSYPDMTVYEREPQNRNNVTDLTSTTGITVGVDASSSGDVAANATYSESRSVKHSIKDWEVQVHAPLNRDITWTYFNQNPTYPGTNGDWSKNGGAFKKWVLKNPNAISKLGLDYAAEAVYITPGNDNRYAILDIGVSVKNVETRTTKRKLTYAEVAHTYQNHTPQYTTIGLDLNWLQ